MTRLLAASCLLGAASLLLGCSDDSSGGNTPGASGSGGSGVSTSGSAGMPSGAGAGSGGASAGSAGQSGGGHSGGGTAGSGTSGSGGSGIPSTEKFSFFVTSLKAMVELSGNVDGFGGDLRFGETGDGAGLKGADKICSTIANKSMPGNNKVWRAFLSAIKGADGNPVNAIDRIGNGPWYDRRGRLVSMNKADIGGERPGGADDAIVDDLPNEDGVPNHEPDVGQGEVDNHDMLTGTDDEGQLYNDDPDFTCNDWTSAAESGRPRCGHSWPRDFGNGPGDDNGRHWMSSLNEAGCAPGVFLIERGGPGENGTKSVGDGGGYGGIYCFALSP